MRVETDLCENCEKEVPVEDLREALDSSDGNRYLMCGRCARQHTKIFEKEMQDNYDEDELEAIEASKTQP